MENEKGPPALGYPPTHRRLFRMLRWTAIVFVAVTVQLPTSHVYVKLGVYAVLAAAAAFDFIWNHVLLRSYTGGRAFTELVLDVVWITVLQLPTGQIHSPFYFLYELPILNSALVLPRREVRIIGAISAFLLIPVLSLHLLGAPLDLNHIFSYLVRLGLISIGAFLGGLLAAQRER